MDSAPLVASYQTVAAFNTATGFEAHGIGSTPRRGTDPRFTGFRPEFADTTVGRWLLRATSETPAMTDFFLRSDSPARGVAVPLPPHPTFGAMPDTRSSTDLGAIPFNASRAEYEGFPFVPQGTVDAIPPSRPVVQIRTR
jgi:hypothetical protein